MPYTDLVPLDDIIEPVFLQRDTSTSANSLRGQHYFYNHFVWG